MVSNALTTLNLTGANNGATVTAVAGERALTVNMNNVTGGTLTNAQATAITALGANVAFTGSSAADAITLGATARKPPTWVLAMTM